MFDQLRPVHSSLGELRYAFVWHWLGWVMLPPGLGIWGIVWLDEGALEPKVRLFFLGAGFFALCLVLLLANWRHELVLKRDEGCYEHLQGLRWSPAKTRGSFDDFERVLFYRVSRNSENRDIQPYFEVVLSPWERGQRRGPELEVARMDDRDEAWAEATKLALVLQCTLEDRSFGKVRPWTVDMLSGRS